MAGGAYIRIKGGNIEIHAPGKVEHKAASHPFAGPAKMDVKMPNLEKKNPLTKGCLKNAANSGSIYVLR